MFLAVWDRKLTTHKLGYTFGHPWRKEPTAHSRFPRRRTPITGPVPSAQSRGTRLLTDYKKELLHPTHPVFGHTSKGLTAGS